MGRCAFRGIGPKKMDRVCELQLFGYFTAACCHTVICMTANLCAGVQTEQQKGGGGGNVMMGPERYVKIPSVYINVYKWK